MTFTVFVTEGQLIITADGTTISANQAVDPDHRRHGTITTWSTPRPITELEIERGEIVDDVYIALGYGELTYIVQPGDNFFRIAERFDTCVSAVLDANNMTEAADSLTGSWHGTGHPRQ